MSPTEYFKKYPGATEVWQVGTDLFHFRYRASASAHSERTNRILKLLTRKQFENADKPNAASEQPKAK